MWIIPNNYRPSSAFVPDTLESKEDLILLESNIESSLMWRSKPSPLRTWSQRWKRVSWLPRLFGRTLKPSQHTSFEAALTSSLAAIRASRSPLPEPEKEQTIPDICGRLSGDIPEQLDLLDVFLKTSKDISRLDSPASSAIWKKMVTQRRGEYSVRKKLALLTVEKESLSWPTATVNGNNNRKGISSKSGDGLATAVKINWATPNTMDYLPQRSEEATLKMAQGQRKGRSRPSNLREQVNPKAEEIYQKQNWPTPDVAQAEKVSNRPNYGQLGLANHPEVHGVAVGRPKMKKDRNGQPGQVRSSTTGNPPEQFGKLNPDWVETLMDLPTGWTALDCWGTE